MKKWIVLAASALAPALIMAACAIRDTHRVGSVCIGPGCGGGSSGGGGGGTGDASARNWSAPSYGNGTTLYIDNQASSSCSGGGSISNSNDCSATCSGPGVGPCLDWGALLNKWGGDNPDFNLNTQVKLVSPYTSTVEIAWRPRVHAGAAVGLLGGSYGTLIGDASFTNVTAVQRADAGQNTQVQCGNSISQTGNLIVDGTQGSVMFAAYNITDASGNLGGPDGGTWSVTEPQSQVTLPFAPSSYGSVYGVLGSDDTVSNGDSCGVYVPYSANIAYVEPTFLGGGNAGEASAPNWPQAVYIWRVAFYDPAGVYSTTHIGAGVQVEECVSPPTTGRYVAIDQGSLLAPNGALNNTPVIGASVNAGGPGGSGTDSIGFPGVPSTSANSVGLPTGTGQYANLGVYFIAGGGLLTLGTNPGKFTVQSANWSVKLDGDFEVLGDTDLYLDGQGTLGSVNIALKPGATAGDLWLNGHWSTRSGNALFGSTTGQFWGNSYIHLMGQSQLRYSGSPWSVFLMLGGVVFNNENPGSQVACSENMLNPSTRWCEIPVNNTNLAAAVGDAGFGNNAFIPGGASLVGSQTSIPPGVSLTSNPNW